MLQELQSRKVSLGGGAGTNAEWQAAIESVLFNLPPDHPCVSGRSMLSYYIRRAFRSLL